MDRIDLLVLESSPRQSSEVAAAIERRHRVVERIEPSPTIVTDQRIAVGELSVTIEPTTSNRLSIVVDDEP